VQQQDVLEVVDLVLDDAREKIGARLRAPCAGRVGELDVDLLRAFDLDEDPGEREATFLAEDAAALLLDHGIDEDLVVRAVVARIEDEQPDAPADLRRRESDPARRVHQLQHLLHLRSNRVVDGRHGDRLLQQERVRVGDDVHRRSASAPLFRPF
jgi:hypothetical protein